jgi:beta-galactosidase
MISSVFVGGGVLRGLLRGAAGIGAGRRRDGRGLPLRPIVRCGAALAGMGAWMVAAAAQLPAYSRAGYWQADGSPRRVESLSDGWEFSLDRFKTSRRVVLPHSIDEGELGFEASGGVNRQQPAWYRRRFTWTRGGARQFLHFEAIMGKSRLTLNGRPVAEHVGGYLPIHVEVTGLIREGENLLEVWCDNSDDPSYPPGKPQRVLDFAYFGGIYRDAYLIETGEAYVTDTDRGGVWITSTLAADGRWTVRADVTLGGATDGATARLFYDGKSVVSPFHPESPALWSPESPHLHWLRVDVVKNGTLTDRVNVRFGIRDFKMTTDGFFLNGKRYGKKLIGTNRHQDYAFIGNALPNSLHWRDVKKFKDCGMNIFRCAHYPQDPAFMDACDELGMFVINATPGWQFWNGKDPRFERRVYDDIEKMVRRDRSRPSHIFWEPILNETHFPGAFTTNAVAVVRRNALPPNNLCACDRQSRGSDACDIGYAHKAFPGGVQFRREWGDYVDNWNAQNSPSRVLREWGECAMVRQAEHYMKFIRELERQPASGLGGCLWHGTDHARGYHPDNMFGGIMTYARQKKYSWYAMKARLTDRPFVYVAHELSQSSPEKVAVFANVPYKATLLGRPFVPGETHFDYELQHRIARKAHLNCLTVTTADGRKTVRRPAGRLAKITLDLDTEGIAPVADGSDLVAVTATLSDAAGTPKRYLTETILFSVDGEAEIVGTNPQVTRWGEAVVLVRPRAAAAPRPITLRARTVRRGLYAPAEGKLSFTPGSPDVKVAAAAVRPKDAQLKEVEAQQRLFEKGSVR